MRRGLAILQLPHFIRSDRARGVWHAQSSLFEKPQPRSPLPNGATSFTCVKHHRPNHCSQ